ncbi:MAG: MotA/TolQ/ExbB proton channel family protein [Methanobacteriaceae archaeon]|jgi:biopolymer transport protein ExbB/TolQ|nr:MotA/TolQ/ExbB proton channel family protein [Methanobacteriaceae archaeon]MDP2836967.1 MotA/TolQ/ExbB proton channel family protein [Methanobacteriaceae archaeon]MDP3034916.1 MotA/TolQ/ExbB proton channel family protein [Methanobacteriaceae archaeon]MDP3485574.1 MotA/TolQ/ExbB proton channel family protein [Methanobacteriaceae archaeon]MDP3624872.1 MotA/TolQ/ExbB proton channel family protein [Methanobacteriaceae archaeon]
MMENLFNSEILTSALHLISQALLIPVIIGLLLFFAYALVSLGTLFYEYYHRIRINIKQIESMIISVGNTENPQKIVETVKNALISQNQKNALIQLAESFRISSKSREAFARKLLESEEIKAAKKLEKTDIVTRLGPTLGLMGTLIPMGPGLAALGGGDIQGLAQAIIVAFDTTVVGLAAGGLAYVISKIRRRWYEEDLSNLEVMAESVLEVMKNA